MKRAALIDANFLAYRAKFATGQLSYGNYRTGIIYSFFNQVFTIAKIVKPDEFIFFWDSKKSKRREIYSTYKEKRREPKTEIEEQEWKAAFRQFNKLRKTLLPECGFVNSFMQSGYEADDLIAKYVQTHGDAQDLIIVTSDDDLLQLLDKCSIYNLGKEKYVRCDDFISEYGILPSQWGYVKQLAGCTSDNVDGVPGVGTKTAIKYVRKELKEDSKAYKSIMSCEEVIERNKELVLLPFEGTELVDFQESKFDMLNFLRMCRKYGMASFRKDDKKEEIKSLFLKGENDGKRKTEERRSKGRNKRKESSKGSQESKRKGFGVR